ncbi:MAG: DNA-directed RNA polymerase subunit alpha C-terminal domain-containing protein [Syntrophales bacterium]|nr:DNA-directed RNA polymerase subunit alpha C-terminal domain-containing protein [Syntrophales bacterium]
MKLKIKDWNKLCSVLIPILQGETLRTVANKLNISPERVRQLVGKGIRVIFLFADDKNLSKKLDNKGLKEYRQHANEILIHLRNFPKNFYREIGDMPEEDISVRLYNCMKYHGFKNINEMKKKTDSELLSMRNVGEKTLREIRRIVL